MKEFLVLVKNDSKFEKGDRRQRSLLNSIIFGIAYALVLGGFTWANLQGFINGGFLMWCFLISIPFGNSIYLLNKEWKEGTTGWWLALPYTRVLLLSAKCVASFWRVLKVYAIFFAATQIMTLFGNFIPNFRLSPSSSITRLASGLC